VHGAAVVERRGLDFGAAEVDPDAKRRHPCRDYRKGCAEGPKKRGRPAFFRRKLPIVKPL
jgi:hypothetical protein